MKKIKNLLIFCLLGGVLLSINGQQPPDSTLIKKDSIYKYTECLKDSLKQKNEQLEKLLQFLK